MTVGHTAVCDVTHCWTLAARLLTLTSARPKRQDTSSSVNMVPLNSNVSSARLPSMAA